MKPVKWGILSVSKHYTLRCQIPLRYRPEVEVLALASRDLPRAKDAAAKMGIPRAYGSYEEVLADKDVEAVYIPLPNHLHAEWVKKAADAGKHVLCEKPFALDAAETENAIAYARKKGVLVMEAFMYRFHPQWRRVKELLQAGEIGDLRFVQTLFCFNNRDPKNIRNRKEAGGGAIYDIGCYAVSSARYIVEKEPVRVVSLVSRDPDFGTDFLTSAILDYGTVRSVFTVGTQCQPNQRIDIIGTSGSITITMPFNLFVDMPATLVVTTSQGTRTLTIEAADHYGIEFAEFSRAIREGKPVPTPPEDAVANMKVLDALFRSEKSGGWEKVG